MTVDTISISLDVFSQMALDEALLVFSPNESLTLRFYSWAGPAATFGRHQSFRFIEQELEKAGKPRLSRARRITGGGLVFHEGDLTFSLTFPWVDFISPAEIYQRLHHLIAHEIAKEGVFLDLKPEPPATPGLNKICFSMPEKSDLMTPSGKKILGGALCRKNRRGLYQGSLQAPLTPLPLPQIEQAIYRATALFGDKEPEQKTDFISPQELHSLVEKYHSDEWQLRIS